MTPTRILILGGGFGGPVHAAAAIILANDLGDPPRALAARERVAGEAVTA